MREATVGATYDTTRGTFRVLGVVNMGLMLQRSDSRIVQVALSDWNRWLPHIVADNPSQAQDE